MLVLAKEWEIIESLPVFRFLKVPKPDFDFFDFEEAARLIEKAETRWKPMIVTALKTGMRHGELCGLRWEDVDLITGRLMVRQAYVRGRFVTRKSGKQREIPLGNDVMDELKRYKQLKDGLVFCDDEGNPLTHNSSRTALYRNCKKAGLRRAGWHMLRHTFASHLAMKGAPPKSIQELMGHSTLEMTNRYMHLSPDARRDAVRLLDKFSGEHVNIASTRN